MTESHLADRMMRSALAGVERFPVPAVAALIAGFVLAEAVSGRAGLAGLFAALAGFFWSMAAAIAWEREGARKLLPALPGAAAAAIILFAGRTDALAAGTGFFLLVGGIFALLWALTRPLAAGGGWASARSDLLAATQALAVAGLACLGLTGVVLLFGLLFEGGDLSAALGLVWGLCMGAGAPLFWFARIGPRGAAPPEPGAVYRGLVLWLLLPLAAIYLLVLHVFAFRLLPDFDLPDGGTGWAIVLFLTTIAIALHASAGLEGGKRLAAIQRWAPATMIAPAAVVIFAAAERIDAYGLTEPRIALIALGLWALVMSAGGYVFRPLHGLRWQAAGVAVAASILSFGPFSATSLSIADQRNIYAGLVAADDAAMGREESRRLVAVNDFLHDREALDYETWRANQERAERWYQQVARGESLFCHVSFQSQLGGPIDIARFQEMLPRIDLWTAPEAGPNPAGFTARLGPRGVVYLTDAQGGGGVIDLDAAVAAALQYCNADERTPLPTYAAPIADGTYGLLVLDELRVQRRSVDASWGVETLNGVLLRP